MTTGQYVWQTNNEGDLCAGSIKKFLKLKEEASGWPNGCESNENKEHLVTDIIHEREGFLLDHNMMELNLGLRCRAKLSLNFLWGRFRQRDDDSHIQIVKNVKEFVYILTDPNIEVTAVIPYPQLILELGALEVAKINAF
ncbi:hypothetical protein J437_LFUL018332 [Ladona fulva]|uniref:Uncharacterized protein n=1 Tax=Ladona fulva TaxID=123851 RepID=A0A8K0KUD3_LADFU|nr:hypothetical protein J437_LFUL018332 [Ladona fulva]